MFQTQQGAGGSSVVAVQTPTSFSSTSLVNSPHHPAGSWSLQRKQSPDGRPSNNRALDGGHNKNTLSRPTISGGLSTACPSWAADAFSATHKFQHRAPSPAHTTCQPFFFLPRLYIYTDKLGDWFCHGKQMDKPQRKHVLRQSNQIYSDIRIKQATRISEGRDMGITDNMHGSSYTWIAVYKQQVGTRRHIQFLFSHTRAIPHSQIKHAWNQFA
jgi:hypothetical protein